MLFIHFLPIHTPLFVCPHDVSCRSTYRTRSICAPSMINLQHVSVNNFDCHVGEELDHCQELASAARRLLNFGFCSSSAS
jgi:hypothetical protein